MEFAAIIVAAGSGTRLGGEAKQWRLLAGRPVLSWSVESLLAAGAAPVVLVVAEAEMERARAAYADRVRVVAGGATRQASVRAGLAAVSGDAPAAILVHDAARPFVNASHVARLLDALAHAESSIPALAVADTLKRRDDAGLSTVDRRDLWRAQTPQAFRHGALARAFAQAPDDDATDDAAVVEASGGRVVLVPGDPLLMKITQAEDWTMAEAIAASRRVTRTGQGFDVHAFAEGRDLWLCGVKVAHDRGLAGHSDADVGLHALVDALLGAIGAGDIGDHFPPSDPKWKGAASDLFVRHAADLVAGRGGRIVNVDVTLICERPKIAAYRQAMRARMAELLGMAVEAVSLKATTTEGLGFTGRGEGIAAQALACVEVPA